MTSDGGAERARGDALETVLRWEASGGVWEVLRRSATSATIALLTCTAGEQVDQVVTDDPAVLAHLGDRERSDS